MKIFEGKSPAERNKIIAAGVLGAMALLVVVYNIMNLYPSRKASVTVTSASPTPTGSPRRNLEVVSMPSREEELLEYTSTPIFYRPGAFYAPDAGRNIFAFYEPPPPTPYVEPPVVIKPSPTPPIPSPTPPPPLFVGNITPQNVYAGSKTFRIEVNGDKFTPDSLIYLNGTQLPTNFISAQKLTADVPSNMIAGAGALQLIVSTPDGSLYSNPMMINVQAPPLPSASLQYVGMIARKRFNNDTAYFQEKGKETPIGRRLNDVVGGRFRITSIAANEVVLEDVNLGFRHPLPLTRPALGQSAAGNSPYRGNPNEGMYSPYTPGTYTPPAGDIPGIPSNIPRYIPPQPAQMQPAQPQSPQVRPPRAQPKPTVIDEDDDGDN